MTQDPRVLISTLWSAARVFWVRLNLLLLPYWKSEAKLKAFTYLFVIFALVILNSQVIVLNSNNGARLMSALAERNESAFWQSYPIGLLANAALSILKVFSSFVTGLLIVRWREWMTLSFMERYTQAKSFYKVNFGLQVDNPDERIEDIRLFVKETVGLASTLITCISQLLTYVVILFSISREMVPTMLVYVFVGTVVTLFLGRKLPSLSFLQLKKDADFRFGLAQIRVNSESIAFYNSEEQSHKYASEKLDEAIENNQVWLRQRRNLEIFTTPFRDFLEFTPMLLLAPLLFGGRLNYGTLFQACSAFSHAGTSLSFLATQFSELAKYSAAVSRLGGLLETMEHPDQKQLVTAGQETQIITAEVSSLVLEHLCLWTPDHQQLLVDDLSFSIGPAEGLAIVGPSGSGKSSLLRAICGLWTEGSGKIGCPDASKCLFLPQQPYVTLGNLRDQLTFPSLNRTYSDDELQNVLSRVDLSGLPEQFGGFDANVAFADVLSLGQQQLLAVARVVLCAPQFVFLDEGTSALDAEHEKLVYDLVTSNRATVISVCHRQAVLHYHRKILSLLGDGKWSLK